MNEIKYSIAPPTMTLEEFAQLEMEEAKERAEKEKSNEDIGRPLRYEELVKEGKEDEEDLMDLATKEDRKWDNWKDENTKGSGNTIGKRY